MLLFIFTGRPLSVTGLTHELDCHGINISWLQTPNTTHYNVTVIGNERVQFTNVTNDTQIYYTANAWNRTIRFFTIEVRAVNPTGVSDPTMLTIDTNKRELAATLLLHFMLRNN